MSQAHFPHRDVFLESPNCKGEHDSEAVAPQTSSGSLAVQQIVLVQNNT